MSSGRKVLKNAHPHHRITLRGDSHEDDRVILVKGGKRSYLWIDQQGPRRVTVSGRKSLIALAHAILDEMGETP